MASATPICPVCEQPTACDHPTIRAEVEANPDGDGGFERDYCPDCGIDLMDADAIAASAPKMHAGCCSHDNVDLAMDALDPARESRDTGHCIDCDSDVVLELDEEERTGFWALA